MDRDGVWAAMVIAVREETDSPDAVVEPAMTANDVPGWDSLAHVRIVMNMEARTGAVIVAYPGLLAATYAGQGIVGTVVQAAIDSASEQSVAEKLAFRYGEIYRNWLLRQS